MRKGKINKIKSKADRLENEENPCRMRNSLCNN